MKASSTVRIWSGELQAAFVCADTHRPGNLGRSVSLSQLPWPPVQFSFNGQPGLRADRETAIRGQFIAYCLLCPHSIIVSGHGSRILDHGQMLL